MFTLNEKQQPVFRRAWEEYVSRRTKSGKKIPDLPSVGWLQEVAVRNNLCFNAGRIGDAEVVCGAELWKYPSDDSYLCAGCYATRKKVLQEMKESA
ncbi:MAG: hypothetical protein D6698_05280 [Gammaproteobacteria bacterium]|nr:MAG: hypothetical protein D6698_05280 [Gammaproteobacteria bacterium]